jgi:hypothetical protein
MISPSSGKNICNDSRRITIGWMPRTRAATKYRGWWRRWKSLWMLRWYFELNSDVNIVRADQTARNAFAHIPALAICQCQGCATHISDLLWICHFAFSLCLRNGRSVLIRTLAINSVTRAWRTWSVYRLALSCANCTHFFDIRRRLHNFFLEDAVKRHAHLW